MAILGAFASSFKFKKHIDNFIDVFFLCAQGTGTYLLVKLGYETILRGVYT